MALTRASTPPAADARATASAVCSRTTIPPPCLRRQGRLDPCRRGHRVLVHAVPAEAGELNAENLGLVRPGHRDGSAGHVVSRLLYPHPAPLPVPAKLHPPPLSATLPPHAYPLHR